ncbi:MAG: zf-HC2 domain-containing protein [Nitrospirota bacterium]
MDDCHRIRQLVHAAVDRELDVKDSLHVHTHVAGCEDCRDIFLGEQTFVTLTTAVLAPSPAPERTRRAVRETLSNEVVRVSRRKRRRRALIVSGAVAVLVAVGVFLTVRHAGVPDLVHVALAEHRLYMNNATRLQIQGSDARVVGRWLNQQAPFPLHIPPHNHDLRLVGASVRPAPDASAILAYKWEGKAVSLLIAPAQPMPFDDATAMTFRNVLYHTAHIEGRQVLQWSDDRYMYVLISCREFPIASLPFDVPPTGNSSY